jgi:hypothetical protein
MKGAMKTRWLALAISLVSASPARADGAFEPWSHRRFAFGSPERVAHDPSFARLWRGPFVRRDSMLPFYLYFLYFNDLPPFEARLPYYFRGFHPQASRYFGWPYNYGAVDWPSAYLDVFPPTDSAIGAAERNSPAPVPEPALDETSSASVRLGVSPADATIYADGRYYGTADDAGTIRLAAGRHRLAIVRDGYRAEEQSLVLQPHESRELKLVLRPR